MQRFTLFLSLLFFVSCSNSYLGRDRYGADEFVLDSYKIREGKFAILEMSGCEPPEEAEEDCEGSSGAVGIVGLVGKSSVAVDGTTRLFEVLSAAVIGPSANLFKSYVLRDGKVVFVDLYKLLKEGDMSQNLLMRGGDRIYIADEKGAAIMVMGEVNQQRVVPAPNGYLPLQQALAEAGGIRFTGDKSYIQVIRGGLCCPKIYTLRWEHIIQLPSDSLLLMPQDIVYVVPKPITEWHRFVSQLIPSICGV